MEAGAAPASQSRRCHKEGRRLHLARFHAQPLPALPFLLQLVVHRGLFRRMLSIKAVLTLHHSQMEGIGKFPGRLRQTACDFKIRHRREFDGRILQTGMFITNRTCGHHNITGLYVQINSSAGTCPDKGIRSAVVKLFHGNGRRRPPDSGGGSGEAHPFVVSGYSPVFSVRGDYTEYGATPLLAIRTRFTNNKVLFGSVILVGSLEDESYQRLKDSSGFGVVPVPLYHNVDAASSETYLTSIHNVGRAGGIAANTRNFAQVTAFLNYQSTHSTDILNQYYDYKLQYDIADGTKGTVEMLQYIRLNVRSSFDKTFEDAIGVFYETTSDRWHSILLQNNYEVNFRPEYERLYSSKEGNLRNLIKEYDNLPG